MTLSTFLSLGILFFSVLLIEVSAVNFLEKERALAASAARRNLFWTIDFVPQADPQFVCDSFQKAANGTYECSCDIQPDKSVGLKCLETEATCNPTGQLCLKQNVNMFLTPENVLKEIETCTQYTDIDFAAFEGSSTQYANYSTIMPCVKVVPETIGDFSTLESCGATINGEACHKCEICSTDMFPLGISMDCCNTQVNGTQLSVECGQMGGGGAFVPFFDTYEEGEMGKCSGATVVVGFRSMLGLVVSLVVAFGSAI